MILMERLKLVMAISAMFSISLLNWRRATAGVESMEGSRNLRRGRPSLGSFFSGTSLHAVFTRRLVMGNDNKGYNDSTHEKYCGEKFWTLISGEPTLFVDIVEPLGFKAKEKNEEYYAEYGRMINKFTKEFIADYCNDKGDINWDKIVRLNAGIKQPRKKKESKAPKD